jgi:hypothetical protein
MSSPLSTIVGREQHVIFPVVEGGHALLDLGRLIWPCAVTDVISGTCSARNFSMSGRVGDPRRDEIALPAAIMLAQQAPSRSTTGSQGMT